jgi:ABC-type microcin C transport system duplicated ATPase subunit YejF
VQKPHKRGVFGIGGESGRGIVAEPLAIHEKALSGEERDGKAVEMLRRAGLDESALALCAR